MVPCKASDDIRQSHATSLLHPDGYTGSAQIPCGRGVHRVCIPGSVGLTTLYSEDVKSLEAINSNYNKEQNF